MAFFDAKWPEFSLMKSVGKTTCTWQKGVKKRLNTEFDPNLFSKNKFFIKNDFSVIFVYRNFVHPVLPVIWGKLCEISKTIFFSSFFFGYTYV